MKFTDRFDLMTNLMTSASHTVLDESYWPSPGGGQCTSSPKKSLVKRHSTANKKRRQEKTLAICMEVSANTYVVILQLQHGDSGAGKTYPLQVVEIIHINERFVSVEPFVCLKFLRQNRLFFYRRQTRGPTKFQTFLGRIFKSHG